MYQFRRSIEFVRFSSDFLLHGIKRSSCMMILKIQGKNEITEFKKAKLLCKHRCCVTLLSFHPLEKFQCRQHRALCLHSVLDDCFGHLLRAKRLCSVYLLSDSCLAEMFKCFSSPTLARFPAKSISSSLQAQLQTDRCFHPPKSYPVLQ